MSEFEWELSKENVQPLCGGRDVGKLNSALSAPPGPRDSEIAAYESAIKEAASGKGPNASDPLTSWVSYIGWLRESYPNGSPRIARAIERACHTYKESRRYKDDPRYVRLWISYIAPREDQLDVFRYMRSKGIGYHSAIFYEAWANTFERAHIFEKAQKAYELGQKRGALPTERLEARLNGFHARMAARKRRDEARAKKAAAKDRAAGPSTRPRPSRRALVSLRSDPRSVPSGSPTHTAPSARPPTQPHLRADTSGDPLEQLRALQPVLDGDSFEVFNDSAAPPDQPEDVLDGEEGEDIPFPSVVRRERNTKENRMEPEQWRGAVIKQDPKLIQRIQNRQGPAPEFEVYRDPPSGSGNVLGDDTADCVQASESLESFREKMSDLVEVEAAENDEPKIESTSVFNEAPLHPGLSESFGTHKYKQAGNVESSEPYAKLHDELVIEKPMRKLVDLSPIPEGYEVHHSKGTTRTLAQESSDVSEDNKSERKAFSACEDKNEPLEVFQDRKSNLEEESFEVYQDENVQAIKPQPFTAIPQSPDDFPGKSTGLTPQFESLSIGTERQANDMHDSDSQSVKKSKKMSIMAELDGLFTYVPKRELSDHEEDRNATEDAEVYPDQPPVQKSFEVYEDNANAVPIPVQKSFEDSAAKENVPRERHADGENIAPSRHKGSLEKKKKGLAVRDQENVPRSELPPPPSSPTPLARNPSFARGGSPTINTKIATRDIENMFSMPLPHEEEEEFTLLNGPDNPVEETFEVYRDPAPDTSAFPQEESFEVFQDPAKPSPVPSTDAANASSDDDDDKFVIRPGGLGSSFSAFNEIFASMTKENNSEDEVEPSEESQRRLERDEVLNPIAELEGVAPPERLIAIPGPFEKPSNYTKSNLLSDLQEWCELERNYYVLDNALADVKEGQVLILDAGHRDIRKFSVDGVAGKGYRGAADVFIASAVNRRSDLAGFGPVKNYDGVFSLKVQKSNAWEFYVYKTLHQRIGRRVSDIPMAMAVFDDQSVSRSAMLINCVSDGSMAEILRLTPRNCFDETVTLFFTVSILRAVEAVHECGIVHADVTLDNLLLRNEDRPLTSPRYCSDGKNGWDQIGVFLVDFNMAFDSRHSSIEDCSPAIVAEMVSKRGNDHVIPEYRKMGSSLWAFDADCYAASICAAKMLGLSGRDLESCHRLLRHESIWNTFFSEMSALTHLSTAHETVSVMRRNRMAMESVLIKDFSLKSSLTKVIMRIAEAKYAEDVTKTIGF